MIIYLLFFFRYLATGKSFRTLAFDYLRGESTVGEIIAETCGIIWDILSPLYMPYPTEERWLEVSKDFNNLWQMPNCIGSIDGKHVEIQRPSNTGSLYFNYMGHFSMVLLAVSDAHSNFIMVSVGEYGRSSDGGVLKNSQFGRLLHEGKMNIPSPAPLPNEQLPFPYYFIGDEAFPLSENIMRPYPARVLTNEKRIFNGRLSRARKTIECAFGRMSSKFRVLQAKISCEPNKIEKIVKATCILHNFIQTSENISGCSDCSDSQQSFGSNLQSNNGRSGNTALYNRDRLREYFLKRENAVPWQHKYCV